MEQIDVLGTKFHNITLAQAVEQPKEWLAQGGLHTVVTPNPEFILQGQQDTEFQSILNAATLVIPDGIGVIYSAKLLGTPLQERVAGIDFATALLQTLAERGGSIFLLGAKDGVAAQAGENICNQYQGLVLAGTHHGYFKQDQEEEIANIVRETNPDVIFVCLGAPRQEKFIAQWGETMGVTIAIGLGGVLDVYAGTVERAPQWWIDHHLEWLYRLKKEPWRWKRMAKLPIVLLQAIKIRLFGKPKQSVKP
ncbi:MAG: WecB/TagA/CpsF family glycosyltransferase [Eubacteriales bacterium]